MKNIPQEIKDKAAELNETIVLVTDIKWDLYGEYIEDEKGEETPATTEDYSLPSSEWLTFDFEGMDDDEKAQVIVDYVSDYHGFLVESLVWEEM